MLSSIWTNLLYQPLLNFLIFLYRLTGNFGLAIILLTISIRALLIPLTLPSLKSAEKIKKLQPEMNRLKNKHKNDKKTQQREILKLYQKHGVNPAAGCLPQLAQIIILIALYQVFIGFINSGTLDGASLMMKFLWFDLAKPDQFYILPLLAGGSQFLLGMMMKPSSGHKLTHPKGETKEKKEKEEDMGQMMQNQMTFMMPVMTVLIALKFPAGLALYWVTTTVFSMVQQYFISGLGDLQRFKTD